MTVKQFNDLTPVQERVLELLRGGHTARRTYLTVVEINGRAVCREPTMLALERRGVVQRAGDDDDAWVIFTPGGPIPR